MDGMKGYYDRRASEYDDWYLGTGMYADRRRPGWEEELRGIEWVLARLPAVRTLDAAQGF